MNEARRNLRIKEFLKIQKPESTSRAASLPCLIRKAILLALAFLSKLSFQHEIVVLMYHSIDSTNGRHTVDPKKFRCQLEYLKSNYAIVTLNEILGFIQGSRELPRRAASITFDDGYHSFFSNVYPYISRCSLPATVFVTTGHVDREGPFDDSNPKMLTWDEIEEMSRNRIEIGAHTVTHPNLQAISLKEAKKEIEESKKEIEKHTRKSVDFFSYPFGKFTPEIMAAVKSLGFKAAVGGGGTIRKNARVFALNRIQVDSSVSFVLFKAQLTRAVDWYKRLEHGIH